MYTLLKGRLYKVRFDHILNLCIDPEEIDVQLNHAHVEMGDIHFSKDQTLRRLQHFVVYWPRMRLDVHKLVQSCAKCHVHPPLPYASLFQVQVNPKWGQHIVDYLQKREFPENVNKRHQKAIEIESREFCFIGDQFYKRCTDQQLRLCAQEKEYIPILKQAHAGIFGGHFSAEITAKAILM